MSNELRPSQTRLPTDPATYRRVLQKLIDKYGVREVASKMNWTVGQVQEALIRGTIPSDIHSEPTQGRDNMSNEGRSGQ